MGFPVLPPPFFPPFCCNGRDGSFFFSSSPPCTHGRLEGTDTWSMLFHHGEQTRVSFSPFFFPPPFPPVPPIRTGDSKNSAGDQRERALFLTGRIRGHRHWVLLLPLFSLFSFFSPLSLPRFASPDRARRPCFGRIAAFSSISSPLPPLLFVVHRSRIRHGRSPVPPSFFLSPPLPFSCTVDQMVKCQR